MTSVPAIGIDLGTTFSLAAVHWNGKTEVIPDKEGNRLVPSCVFYDRTSLDVFVGSTAEKCGLREIKNCLFDIKRIIGRNYDDAYVQKLINSREHRFDIIPGENQKAEVELVHDEITVAKSPEQISSEILRYLRECASEYIGAVVTEAVITVPARFSYAQRKATKDAAELAGLKVLKLVTEPVAGAIHYCKDRLQTKATILVVDLGGGTLDVSIIEVEKNKFSVQCVKGNTFLGGRDFDNILLKYVKQQINNAHGSMTLSDRELYRLNRICNKAKCNLSTLKEYHIDLDFLNGVEDNECDMTITRTEFENISWDLITECLNLVKSCIDEAKLSKEDIDEVILVGGSTRIPILRESICSFFNNKAPKTDLNPDEAVALGAAIQAALIKKELWEFEKYQITDVAPVSLGTSCGGLFNLLIKKNTPLPFKTVPITTYTTGNNQKNCVFKMYEGERKCCLYNNYLGSFSINGLPPGRAGEIKFQKTFTLNEDGILEVEAWETTTQHREKLVVAIEECGLTDYTVSSSTEIAHSNRKEDEEYEIMARYKIYVKRICDHIIYDLNKIEGETARTFIYQKCKELKRKIKKVITDIGTLRTEYNIFRDDVSRIINFSAAKVSLQCDEDIYQTVLDKVNQSDLKFYSEND